MWDTHGDKAAVATSGEAHRAQSHGRRGRPLGCGGGEKGAGRLRFQFLLDCHPWVMGAVAGTGWGEVMAGVGLTEELQEAALAVRLVVLLFEGALVELLEAEGTDKVLGVELLGHGGDAAAGDGLLATRAQRASALVVVHLTVRLPIMLKEAAVDKRCEAFLPGRGRESLRSCPGWHSGLEPL